VRRRRSFGERRAFPFPQARRADPQPDRTSQRPGLTRGVCTPPQLLAQEDAMPPLLLAYAAAMLLVVALLAVR
jgi:hypothetical protein